MKKYISLVFIIFLVGFLSCKTTEKSLKEKQEKTKTEVSEHDKLKSTTLLIEASKEKMLENWMNAIALYSEALKHNPENDAAAFELAKIHASNNYFDDAYKYANIALDIDPKNRYYALLLADIYVLKGRLKDAAIVHQRVADMYPKDLSLQFSLLNTYMYINDYDGVIKVLDDIEAQIGFSEELSVEKIQLFLEIGKFDKAIAETKRLIYYFPDEIIYQEYLAEVYTKSGREQEAINLYEDILEKDPDNALARLQLAERYRKEGRLTESFEELRNVFKNPNIGKESKGRIMYAFYNISADNPEYLEEAFKLMDILIEKYPDDSEMYAMYGDFLFREDEKERAREMFLQAVTINPDQYPVWEQMIYISSELEDYEFIIKYTEKALEYFFEQPVLYFFNGIANYQLEQNKEAIKSFEYGVELIVDNKLLKGQFYTLMGDTYNKLGEYEKSDMSYEKALDIDPGNTFALNNYSYFLALRNENLELAKEMSKKANRLEKNNSAYLDTHGWVLYKMGEYEEAEKWIKKAIENSEEENAVILEHYGDVLYKLGQKDKAYKFWQKAKQAGDGSGFLEKKVRDNTLYE